jgi:hypothetical protein
MSIGGRAVKTSYWAMLGILVVLGALLAGCGINPNDLRRYW